MDACFEYTEEHYEKAHAVYKEKSDELVKDKEMIERHLPVAVTNILKGMDWQNTFNVLSVGCGNGETDCYILEIIHKELQQNEKFKDTKIFNCAIDPNGSSISLYKQDINRSLVCSGKFIFDVRQLSWQEYMQERLLNNDDQNRTKFDIVHFIHSLYYLDIEETLEHCIKNELTENGLVVCVISDYIPRNFLSKLRATHKQYGQATAEDNFQEKIKKLSMARGWKVEHYNQEHFIDFTESFQEDSVKGNRLLDFVTQTKNFRATFDEEKVEEILQTMKELSTEKDGRLLSTKVDDLLLIYKLCSQYDISLS